MRVVFRKMFNVYGSCNMEAVNTEADYAIQKQRKDSWSAYFRARRFRMIYPLLEAAHARKGRCSIVDIGGREEYWAPASEALEQFNCHVTLVNLERTMATTGARFSFACGDALDLSDIGTGTFDVAHSNSLIEHVGRWQDMVKCAQEIQRVADSYYVQTPYFWFPLEPHFRVPFYHWLPEQVRARLNTWSRLGYINKAQSYDEAMANVQSCCLLDATQMRALFPDADLQFERVLGLPKSIVMTRAK